MTEKLCKNCDHSYYGYGESSMYYGLRCHHLDKAVEENENCTSFELSDHFKLKELKEDYDKLLNAMINLAKKMMFYADNQSYRSKNGGHIENKNFHSPIGQDCGRKATQALQDLKNLYPKYNCPKCNEWFHMPYKFCSCPK